MITPKLGGEPIPCAFCHVPKYEVFPGLYIYIYIYFMCVLYRHETMCVWAHTDRLGWKLRGYSNI